jgi:hypothetical protein
MAVFQFIEFAKTRDFSNKMNATFEFVKQNFKSLGRAMLYIVGPPALIASLLIGSLMGDYFRAIFGLANGGPNGVFEAFTSELIIKIILTIVVATVTSVITMATMNNYVILYREKQSNQIEVEEVWARVQQTFWMYFWSMIGFIALAIVVYLILILPIVALAAVAPVLIFFGFLAFVIIIMYLLVANSLVFIVRGFEPRGFFESFSRSMFLTRGKWWSTFGLFFVFYLIVSVIGSMFFMPWYMTKIVSTLHQVSEGGRVDTSTDWFGIISMALNYLVSYMLGVLPQIALIFQYFNLVERKESKGLMEKMQGLGSGDQPQAGTQTEHY